MKSRHAAFLAACLGMIAGAAVAEPTDVSVRIISKGAKFVGTGMGGVQVILRDAATGEILADGVTHGGTGDTARIMTEGLTRKDVRWTPGAAQFTARLDIDEPVKVRVEATGPLAQPQAAITVTSEQWVVPGHPVTGGDAWLLELPGFAVDILSPAAHSAASGDIPIRANIVMMCGCPLTPGGLWDSDTYEIKALIYRNGESIDEIPLSYAGIRSTFDGAYAAEQPGVYRIVVIAYDERSGNTGLDQTTVLVE